MKISHDISERFGPEGSSELSADEIEQGMLEKSEEFAAAGNRVYLPLAE
jgi:phosphomethylpyrimidine synthase